ncbi:nucleotidyltransferase family protein [Evansella sp. AB-rgal1]|uniref:nucleotidyltransferase domain-containing protein n=1 Tax=Evansella sp. AB-rgal1 TaxID=3242696 RepID=UPI00359E9246
MDVKSDLTNTSKEFRLMLDLLNLEKGSPELFNNESFLSSIDWEAFLKLSHDHRVFPLLHVAIQKQKNISLPTDVVKALRDSYVKNTMRMMELTAEVERVCKVFQQMNIQALLLKGPALAYQLYRNLSSRTSMDLDFLISIENLDKVTMILQDLGYEIAYESPRVLKDWRVNNHHTEFYHKEKKIEIELHWKLHSGPSHEPTFEEMWREKVLIPITSTPMYTLGNEHMLYHLVTHGAKHGWFRLRWLTDIEQLLCTQNFDLTKTIAKYHYQHVFGQTILLLQLLLHIPIDSTQKISRKSQLLAENAFQYIRYQIDIDHPPQKWKKDCKRYRYNIKTSSEKRNYLIRKFYANSWDAKILPLPKLLHFLYVPLRPFIWLWRMTRKPS